MHMPIYHGGQEAQRTDCGNNGLWFTRFFNEYDPSWTLSDTAKSKWVVDIAAKPAGQQKALKDHTLRQYQLVKALGGESCAFENDWHWVTGMGLPHPVENGLSWHHTLGTPYLTGSAVKGLIRAWVEIWGDESLKTKMLDWFGSDDPNKPETFKAGKFIFFDAIPIEPVTLTADVMTPHMGKWYEQGDTITQALEADKVPADWHDPVPVTFLAVNKIKLLFSIAPRKADDSSGLDEVWQALQQALDYLGAGAKTAAGYGRMLPISPSSAVWRSIFSLSS